MKQQMLLFQSTFCDNPIAHSSNFWHGTNGRGTFITLIHKPTGHHEPDGTGEEELDIPF